MRTCKLIRFQLLVAAWVVLVLLAPACERGAPTDTLVVNTLLPESVEKRIPTDPPTTVREATAQLTDTPQPTATAPPEAPAVVSVPPAAPPTIDGTLSPGEWDAAAIELLSDGSELLLMQADGYLYLGIRSVTRESFATNIYIEDQDQVRILHASAALGTAVYQQAAEGWQRIREFDWKCRSTSNSAAAMTALAAYLQEEHWVAGISPMGTPNELEYQIELTLLPRRIAVSLMRSSSLDERVVWPLTVNDDIIKPTPGGMPPELHFVPAQWAEIELAP